jgi:hypothetical protein
MRHHRRVRLTPRLIASALPVAAVAVAAGVTAPAVSASSSDSTAQLTLVHAMPGVSAVSVYANGERLVRKLNTGTVDGPINVPAGRYSYAVRLKGASSSSTPLTGIAGIVLHSGENDSLVAGYTPLGVKKMWVFSNPMTSLASGKTRVIVRDVANAPALDVYFGTAIKIRALANSSQVVLVMPAVDTDVKVTLHGTSAAVIEPTGYDFKDGQTTVLFVMGSATAKDLGFATQRY